MCWLQIEIFSLRQNSFVWFLDTFNLNFWYLKFFQFLFYVLFNLENMFQRQV